jgi:hypothetical protein
LISKILGRCISTGIEKGGWFEATAVGSLAFVENVRNQLSKRAKRRIDPARRSNYMLDYRVAQLNRRGESTRLSR